MAKHKRKHSSKSFRNDIDDLLRGRFRPSPRRLISLIHDINPTGRLDTPEKKHDYLLKSRLQSIFIDLFSDDVSVKQDDLDAGVVLLYHRTLGRDACHAVIDELDTDARAWVRWQLDTTAKEATKERSPSETSNSKKVPAAPKNKTTIPRSDEQRSVTDWIGEGKTALDEYDYERAQKCFKAAWSTDPTDETAAEALVDFLVEHMGAYDQGLSIVQDARTPSTGQIETLGALAAARLGDLKKAALLAKGKETPPLAEVWLRAADNAIDIADWELAARYIERAERCEPTPDEIRRRRTAVSQGRSEERAPLEAAIALLIQKEDFDKAEAQARAVLDRWPESVAAKKALARVEAHNKNRSIESALGKADNALTKGDYVQALEHFNQVVSLGDNTEEVKQKMERARAALKQANDESSMAQVAELLKKGESEAALLCYIELKPPLRERLRQRHDSNMLSWMEDLSASDASKRKKQHAAQAVIALAVADEKLADGDIEDAARTVSPFEKTLHAIVRYQQIIDSDEERQHRLRKAESEKAFEVFEAAVSEMRLDDAERFREQIRTEDLTAAQSEKHDALNEMLDHALEIHAKEQALRQAEERGDLFEARAILQQLTSIATGEAEQTYQRKKESVASQLRTKWKAWSLSGSDAVDTGAVFFQNSLIGDDSRIQISPDGRKAVHVWARERWIFIRVFDIETSKIESVALLRGETSMSRYTSSLFDGRIVSLMDEGRTVVRFDVDTLDVEESVELSSIYGTNDTLESAFLVPGTDYLYANFSTRPRYREIMKVINIKTMQVEKEMNEHGWRVFLLTRTPLRIAAFRAQKECYIYNHRGYLLKKQCSTDITDLHSVRMHPDGERLILLGTLNSVAPKGEEDDPLYIVSIDSDDVLESPYLIEGSHTDFVNDFGVADDLQVAFVVYQHEDGGYRLLAVSILSNGFEKLYEIELPNEIALIRDIEGAHIGIFVETSEGTRIEKLGSNPPNTTGWLKTEASVVKNDPYLWCNWPSSGGDDDTTGNISAELSRLSPKVLKKRVETMVKAAKGNTTDLMLIAHALRKSTSSVAYDYVDKYVDMLKDNADIRSELQLLLATEKARQTGWDGIVSHLDACDPNRLLPESMPHYHHVCGLVAYHQNDLVEARRHFRLLADSDTPCTHAAPLLVMTGDEVNEDCDQISAVQATSEIQRLIREADEAMASNDMEKARRILDIPLVWNLNEGQSSARLCHLMLRYPDLGPADTFRKIYLLASMLYNDSKSPLTDASSLRLGDSSWDDERLGALKKEAEVWLENWTPPIRRQ